MSNENQIKNAINWIEKLATAEKDGIKRGTRQLKSANGGFCCLGYGCFLGNIEYRPEASFSEDFTESVGLHDDMGTPISNGSSCVTMNDSLSLSFSEISAELKEYVSDYFIPEVAKGINEHFDNALTIGALQDEQ
jgi:hypothetical protein